MALFVSEREVRENFNAETILVDMYDELGELLLVSEDYFSFPNERALMQWNLRNGRILKLLVEAENSSKLNTDETLRLRQKINYLNSSMLRLVKFDEESRGDPSLQLRVHETMATRLREEIRLSLGITIKMSQSIRNQLEKTFLISRYLSFVLVVFVMLVAIFLGRWVYTKVLWPVDELRREAKYIRAGKFSHRINSSSTDEIGLLANDFDAMVEKLEKTMVSRNELEKNVSDRTNLLRLAKDSAEQASEAKSIFLSRVSHELRTPLNAILGFSQMLQLDENINELNRQNVDLIYSSGTHLLNLINEVLDITRIEQGNMQIIFEVVNVKTVLQEIITMTAVQADDRSLKVNNTVQANVVVRADGSRLKQVLINLMSNAIKYNRQAGQITIFLAESVEGKIDICFKDTGIGIKKEKQDRLFIPFERLLDDKYSIDGVGLGLALSCKIAELMGGELGFVSEYEQGSTFWVRLELMA